MRDRTTAKLVMLAMVIFSAVLMAVYASRTSKVMTEENGIYSDTLYRRMGGGKSTVMAAGNNDANTSEVINKETGVAEETATSETDSDTKKTSTETEPAADTVSDDIHTDKDIKTVNVYDHRKDEVMTMNLDEYVACVVTAEMPGDSPFEALCAQAVAARTLATNYIMAEERSGHKGADICTDSGHCQSFVTRGEYMEKYGDRGKQVFDNATNAAMATRDLVLLYEDMPIVAVFHASSGGATASGKEVWGGDLAYLKSVESGEIYDETLKEKVISEAVFSREELISRLEDAVPGISEYKESPFHLWIGEKERSESGRVSGITIGGKRFTGNEVRKLLGLRSADFEIRFSEDTITFITEGYGHGVGMSQLGAVAMARKGESFYSILAAYYPGTVIGIL